MAEYLKGNTLRFEAEFRNWDTDKSLTDPSTIKFIIRDLKFNILEEFVVGTETKLDTGIYYFLYTPKTAGFYHYEWYCEIEGLPTRMIENLRIKEVL